MASKRVVDKARIVAAAMMEVSPEDLECDDGTFSVKGDPTVEDDPGDRARRARDAGAARRRGGPARRGCVYDPPNLTYPFGAYICVVDVDAGTGEVKVRRFVAVDDCGPRINPMIVEGQIHGGLADGIGMALMEVIAFDEGGNCLGGSFMDYQLPTSMECPSWSSARRSRRRRTTRSAEGRGRVGHRRVAGRSGQRRRRRAEAVRRPPRRHAAHAGAGVADDPGPAVPDRPGDHRLNRC